MNDLTTATLTKMIKSAITHAPKKDLRYYLNGVYFKLNGTELCLVATDGHRLIELKTTIFNPYNFEGELILGHDYLKVLLLQITGAIRVDFKSYDGMKLILDIGGNEFSYTSIEAKYPDYKRVIKAHDETREQPTNEYGLNISYLADIQKACKVFKRKIEVVKLSIKDATTSIKWTACLDSDNQVHGLGLIMPARL